MQSANSHASRELLTNSATNSMHVARRTPLYIPELLLESFRSLPSDALQTAALVCKTWSPIAIDVLWREREVPLDHLLGRFLPESTDLPDSVRQNIRTKPAANDTKPWNFCLVQTVPP